MDFDLTKLHFFTHIAVNATCCVNSNRKGYLLHKKETIMANYNVQNDPDYYQKRTKSLLQTAYPLSVLDYDFTESDSFVIDWHWHEDIELIYNLEGQAYVTCEEEQILASQGDIVFINQAVKHFITPTNPEGCILRSIIVHPSFIFGFGQLEMEKKYITPVLHDVSLKHLHITPDTSFYEAFRAPIIEIITQNAQKPIGFELVSKASILHIWKELFSLVAQHNPVPSKKIAIQDEQRVKQAILYIQEHYMESITLDDIADSILVSKSECCRCFKRTLNVTPFEYLMKYRILESTKKMHKKTLESISEIAGAVGFNNTSYYNKIFKKYMNCTPTEYRTSIKKELPPLKSL